SEMLVTHSELFIPYDLRWRVFRKVPRAGMREHYGFVTNAGAGVEDEPGERYARLRDGAADLSPVAQIVVDRTGIVANVSQAARTLFGLGPAELGRALHHLESSCRPVDLRSGLGGAYETRAPGDLG